jgi:hypothetical protein
MDARRELPHDARLGALREFLVGRREVSRGVPPVLQRALARLKMMPTEVPTGAAAVYPGASRAGPADVAPHHPAVGTAMLVYAFLGRCLRTPFIADELADRGFSAGRNRVARFCSQRRINCR